MYNRPYVWFTLFSLFFAASFAPHNPSRPFDEDTLVIGARPTDRNIVDHIKDGSINKAQYVDIIDDFEGGSVKAVATNFHHLDLNNEGEHGAGNFTDFVDRNPARFKAILIDGSTYHHFRRDAIWQELHSLLKMGGKLVVPIYSYNANTHENVSQKKAELFAAMKLSKFKGINLYSSETLGLEDLPRSSLYDQERMNNPDMIFVVATKY